MDGITARLERAKEWDQAVYNEEMFFPSHGDHVNPGDGARELPSGQVGANEGDLGVLCGREEEGAGRVSRRVVRERSELLIAVAPHV